MAEKKRKLIVVDAANVAHEEPTQRRQPRVSNIVAMRRALEEMGFEPIFIADASLRHEIDDADQYEALVDQQVVRQVPAGTDADYFILSTAEQHGAAIVTNDRYRDRLDDFPWIDERRRPFMIVKGHVHLYEQGQEAESAAAGAPAAR